MQLQPLVTHVDVLYRLVYLQVSWKQSSLICMPATAHPSYVLYACLEYSHAAFNHTFAKPRSILFGLWHESGVCLEAAQLSLQSISVRLQICFVVALHSEHDGVPQADVNCSTVVSATIPSPEYTCAKDRYSLQRHKRHLVTLVSQDSTWRARMFGCLTHRPCMCHVQSAVKAWVPIATSCAKDQDA